MKTGVIGAGAISEIYLKNMIEKHENLQVLGVAARRRESAEKRAAQFGIKAYTVDGLLADPEIEMVVNLTPVEVHYDVIRRALEAGKHVYTEKTMTNDLEKARELAALADEKGLYLGSAPDTFLGRALQAARSAIDGGLLGEVHSFAVSANRNNDVLLSLFPFLRQPGTGVLLDYGVYYVTALASLFGPAARVAGITGAPYKSRKNIMPGPDFGKSMDTPNESQVSAVLQMKNGVAGTLHIDAESCLNDQAYFAVYGTKGILYLADPNQFGGKVSFLPNAVDPEKPAKPVTLWAFTPYGGNDRGAGPAEMARAIMERRPCRASKEMAVHVQETLQAVLTSGKEGRFVEIASTFERPAPLPQRKPPVTNIGHIALQMKNEAQMLRFYTQTLGMKPLFTLTARDLADTVKARQGENEQTAALEADGLDRPWIQYMKISDRQFLELFFHLGNPCGGLNPRAEYYGFQKVNYEVEDIAALRRRLLDAGVALKEDVHVTADGSKELAVLDPDGNEIQFTEYGENTVLPLAEAPVQGQCSPFRRTTQAALQIRDEINMKNFYCRGLGLREAFTLTCGDLADALERSGGAEAETLAGLRLMAERPWITYIEIAPRQYLEFLHCPGQEKKEPPDPRQFCGYQHICLEVRDIREAWEAVAANGITPDTEIALGCEGAYQFWLTDPDGNRLEMMAYTAEAKQLR